MNTQTSRVRRIAGLTGPLVGVLMMAVLAACGSGGGGSDGETSTPVTSAEPTSAPETTEESTVPEETTPYLDPSLGDSSKPGSSMTISGTIEAGVESGCLVLEFEGTVYGIFGNFDASVVYAGATVTLQGNVDDGMMSTCQQGTPFVVEDARPSD
ncbi:hypothetical protein [Glycomyces algeriensis]|uniref:Uncharacterized protein n=1 Tax=Glycomyces algeriensis TaxID=256037 RepID=A0A9W6GE54_9ACTN|nr:hypothetical protein [Glycomyces algeriensis]MDA1369039.1 hypothetical protein [Glycomyces algeriensis]MDR7352465.1 hypothetical protein [Glycomyces algeriensis]GLI45205.1 hypothetical protein GALLR39Z86_50550 [Glycomyces algeriensis]